jgi:hypothetical protein
MVYFNPFLSLEWRWVGMGIGLVASTKPLRAGETEELPLDDDVDGAPSGHFRLGDPSVIFASFQYWESVPIYSGGGRTVVGVGSGAAGPVDLWFGRSFEGPYASEGWMGRLGIDISSRWSLDFTYRDQTSEPAYSTQGEPTIDEWGMAAGLRYHHRRP